MARRRNEHEVVQYASAAGTNEVCEAGVDYWKDAVLVSSQARYVNVVVASRTGIIVTLGGRHHVAGVRKGRDPFVFFEDRVPADVVDVKMGVEDVVDVFRSNAGIGQTLEIGKIQTMEERVQRVFFVISAAGVDQNRVFWRLDEPSMDRNVEIGSRLPQIFDAELRFDCGEFLR